MRHTAATNAAHAGLDAATIQAMGGWKTRAMAERYTHAASMQDAMAALQKQLSGDAITPKLQRRPRNTA
ncbi:Phage integrase family protein [compost metagenome]